MSFIFCKTSRESRSDMSLQHRNHTIVKDPQGHDQGAVSRGLDDDVQIRKGDIVIAIMGPSGSGKSEFINTVAGHQVAPTGADLNSCTEEVRAYKCQHPVEDRYVVLVDTPGFHDSDRTDFTVLDDVTKWLHETYMKRILLSGVLQLHNISEKRMRGPQARSLESLSELCGPEAKANLVMLTTFWDLVNVEVAAAREAELIAKFWRENFLVDGAFVRRFQPRTQDCAWEVVDLFKAGARLTPLPLKIQIEMGDNNKQFYQTSVFQYLLRYWTSLVDFLWGAGGASTPLSIEDQARKQKEKLVGAIPKNRQVEFGVKRKYKWFVRKSPKKGPIL